MGLEASLTPSDSHEMSELERELTILRGATDCLEMRIRELLDKLSPLLSDESQPDMSPPLTEIPTRPPINTPVGRSLHDVSTQLGTLESMVTRAIHRSAL